MHLLLLRWLSVCQMLFMTVLLVLFSTSLPLSGFLWVTQDDTSVSQVGRIFFKESGKTNLFFSTIFHKLPVLVFLFQCFPFTVVLQISSHPASWSHLFNVDLKSGVVPTRCPFSQKICLFSTRTFSARLDFYGFQLRGSSCYFLVPDGPRFQSENVRSTDCMSSIGHSVARLKTKTAIFEALQWVKWLHKNQNRGAESDKKP